MRKTEIEHEMDKSFNMSKHETEHEKNMIEWEYMIEHEKTWDWIWENWDWT